MSELELENEACGITCHAVVHRMGELFGEFGFEFDKHFLGNDVADITKWNLSVDMEDINGSTSNIIDQEVSIEKSHKVIKLKANQFYVVRVRVYSDVEAAWGPWSASIRTSSLNAAKGQIDEIGEDYVRVLWNRPPRDATNVVAERDPEGTQLINDIAGMELRLLREQNMAQEFSETFETGVRAHTVYGLRPGTAYIVLMRYQTLIQTKKNWTELGRFFTQPANIISLESRGEDVIKVSWKLGPKPVDTVGYCLPDTRVHRYEVSVESEVSSILPVEVPAHQHEYRLEDLIPGSLYTFYVRSLSAEGRWGNRSEGFQIRTAERPQLSVVASGETFLSFTWTRQVDEPMESKVEYLLQSFTSAYKQQEIVEVGPNQEDKVFHIQSLTAGTEYCVSVRTYLQGEWGIWSEAHRFSTNPMTMVSFLERGEDFFTVSLEDREGSVTGRFNMVVSQITSNGQRVMVLDDEVIRRPEDPGFRVDGLKADTVYELKCRSWQRNRVTGDEGWGDFAPPLRTQTLQQLALHVWDLGEDFAHLVWRRGLHESGDLTFSNGDQHQKQQQQQQQQQQQEQQWSDLKYEVVVGCVDTGDDNIVHRQVLETNYTITNLRPATTYIVSVRACNEFDQWGLWSKVKVRTLASVITSVHEIGEDFVRLMWQRQNVEDDEEDDGALTTADLFVSKYAVFVCCREDGPSVPSTLSGYHVGGNSEVARYEVVSSEHTSLRVGDLLPDREYIAVVRASTATGKWGLWSKAMRFRSNPQFRIPVNNLTIGENYVNLVWSRDACPATDKDVFLGDLGVTGQQLRIHGVDTPYSKDHTLAADLRELKIYGLSPATAYTIQIRVCGKSGCWGLWSSPVHILTRDTILTKAVEVADDYAIIAWERRKVANPKNYPTGRGVVTSYHLRVYNTTGIHSEVFLGDADCPYRISNLTPDTYYCVELKANYNDEEWGLWSTPLWCLTMKNLEIQTRLISEEFCCITIRRSYQQKRLPEDDGNRATDDRVLAFGQFRPHLLLCVTSPILHQTPHTSTGVTKPRHQNTSLPPDAADHRLIYQTEIICTSDDTDHTIPNLKSNTLYSASVRSKLVNGEWGMWSLPSRLFATVPTTQVDFVDIGEKFITVNWKRNSQIFPPQIKEPSLVSCGLGTISASRVKIREIGGTFQQTCELQNSLTTLRVEGLSPAVTYAVSVQTYNDNYEWGVWSEEGKVRTIPGMDVTIQHVSEDALWVSWTRKSDLTYPVNFDTVLNVDVVAKAYELRVLGDGHFCFTKEMDTNTFFFRGLQPDSVYTFEVRAQSKQNQQWGLWASQAFRTKPRLRVTFGNVGEHFAVVEWRRHLPQSLEDRVAEGEITESPDILQQFRLKVERVGMKAPYLYDLSPYISNFRLKDLQPSAEYRVWLCAKGYEGVWGYWNDEARVRTLPKLELDVTVIGEDYVTVSWSRGKWMGETAADSEASIREVDGAVSGYRVRVLDANGEVVNSQSISFRETSCTLTQLKLSSMYSVEVSAKDTYNEWGLWSDPKLFVTLEAVDLRILQVGESFAEVEWGRRGVLHRSKHSVVSDGEFSDAAEVSNEEETEDENRGDALNPMIVSSLGHRSGHWLMSAGNSIAGDEEMEESFYPDDALRGDDGVLQWQIRVQSHRVFGGQPGAEDFIEFFASPDEVRRAVGPLLPHAVYAVSVRAQDKNSAWGHWSPPRRLVTYPQLALTAESITETFIHVSWIRPPMEEALPEGFVCFPPLTDIHNYQVHIEPLATETPFDEKDEPLVNGARVYETSQPTLRLSNLTPGVRYRVAVREQLIDHNGVLIPDSWGSFSAMTVVEMVNPMGVFPLEIGENYCHVEWRRVQRAAANAASAVSVITGEAKVTGFELRAKRLDDRALNEYHGPLALDTVAPLPASATSFHLKNLVSNTIYAVSVRAQTEGHWGPWSVVTKFVTLNRLQVNVFSVYEDTFTVGWSRPLPVWALTRLEHSNSSASSIDIPGPPEYGDGVSTAVVSLTPTTATAATVVGGAGVGEGVTTASGTETGTEGNDWDSVFLGDYAVELYELYLDGITCGLHKCITLPGDQMSTRITELEHNQIYAVSIRSQSAKKHWSMLSRRESVLTLSPMCVEVSNYTENMAKIHWFRAAQNIMDYADLLSCRRAEVERQCDEREKQDLFALKRRMQEMEASECHNLSDHQSLRREHNAAVRMDAVHHLDIRNVILGESSITGYQMRFYGEGCTPIIPGLNHLLLQQNQQVQRSVRRRRQEVGKRTPARQRRFNDGQQQHQQGSPSPSNTVALEGSGEVCTAEDSQGRKWAPLIDVELSPDVNALVVKDLGPETSFSVFIRARNLAIEWCPWSARAEFTTLRLMELHHRRFGEHYINLYWHRLPIKEANALKEQEHRLLEFNEEFKNLSHEDLEVRKRELSEEEYNNLVARLKSWRDLKRRVSLMRERLSNGEGGVVVHERTPIKGFQLRVIHENGDYTDHYLDNNNEGTCAFTVTGLVSNTMYVVLLSCDYGIGWGPWSSPLKFMTQNLIQLSLEYIAEAFVDIAWHRAPNKQLPPADESNTLTSDTSVVEGQEYQVRIAYIDPDTAEGNEEYRTMRSCSVFRVDKLLTDTKYTFAVREWDAGGDWGLWCTPKTCLTLTGMSTVVEELGEDWALVSWHRKEQRVDYDDDMAVLQYGVENMSYFLMVQELLNNGVEGEPTALALKEESTSIAVHEDEMEGIFVARQQVRGPLPPQEHPSLFEGDRCGRFHMTRRFSPNVTNFKLESLRPDRFYSVQVLCETSGGQLGTWSTEKHLLTMAKLRLTTECIDEQYVDLRWVRPLPRQHPSLDMNRVFTGHYTTTAYILEVTGSGSGSGFHVREQLPGQSHTTFHLKGLALDTVYAARVHSINHEGKSSLWSETLRFVTLNPITVHPAQITEHSVMLEWGREEQQPCGEDGVYDPTICVGSRSSGNYLLRVMHGGESARGVLLEKSFPGDTCSFQLISLSPNTPYVTSVRAANSLGEWGLWSMERCIYTMKLLLAEVAAVGEDFIRLTWKREEPDEVQLVESQTNSPAQQRPPDTNFGTEDDGDEQQQQPVGVSNDNLGDPSKQQVSPKLRAGSRKKIYPLLDRPENKSIVYNSARTRVMSYAVSVMRVGEGDGYTIDVPGDATSFTVPSLRSDVRYTLAIRACYGTGEWGLYSPHVSSGTHNLLALELCALGEDYFTSSWQRQTNSYDVAELSLGQVEETVSYEVAVHDFTDVPFGEETPKHLPSLLQKTIFVQSKQRTCTVKELQSHHRYMIRVRRWYKPIEAFTHTVESEIPNTEDEEIREQIGRNNATPGTWSEGLYAVTLRDMVCVLEEGTEDFFVVKWERDPHAPALPVRNNFVPKPVQSYHLRIDEMTPDGTAVDTTAGSFRVDHPLGAEQTSYQAQNMKPDSVYRVDVRCCVDRVWGRWSRPIYVMTLTKLVVDVTSIGEDYAHIGWQRPQRRLVLPDGTEAVTGNDEAIDTFHLEVVGLEHSFNVSKKFKGTRTSYRVKQLEANTIYTVSIRSSDMRRGTWSLWSEGVRFATLKPLRLSLGPAAEQFVTVEWHREEQSATEYDESGESPILIGSPEVIAYHLCVFNVQHTPSLAVVDKQFPKDVNRYCLNSLTVDTPYAVIVRACNAESRWGLWSREGNFRTLRLLDLRVTNAGENYVHLQWEREEGDRADDGPGARAEPIMYQLLLRTDFETIERLVPHAECGVTEDDFKLPTYVVKGLKPATNYLVALQPGYEENRWGLWTATVSFKTLQSVTLSLVSSSADRVELTMCRTPENVHTAVEEVDADATAIDARPGTSTGAPVRFHVIVRRVDSTSASVMSGRAREVSSPLGSPISRTLRERVNTYNPEITPENSSADLREALPRSSGSENNDEGLGLNAPNPASSMVTSAMSRRPQFVVEREVEMRHGGVTPPTCVFDGLESSASYLAQARAMDEHGVWGSWVHLPFETAPLPPRAVTLRRLHAPFCLLQWEAPDSRHAYRYIVEQAFPSAEGGRGKARDAIEWRAVDAVEETNCRLRLAAAPGKMRCRVRCVRPGEGSQPSEPCDPVGLSSGTPPDPVAGLLVSSLARGAFTVDWAAPKPMGDASPRVRGLLYRVYLGILDGAPVLVATTRANSHTLSDLEPSTEYAVQVVAESADGMSYNNPTLRVVTKGEHDRSVARHEPGQQPLGTLVEPLSAARRNVLPDIPLPSRQATGDGKALMPTPPAERGGRGGRRAASIAGPAAADASRSGSVNRRKSSASGRRPGSSRGTPKKKKRDRLPSVKRQKR